MYERAADLALLLKVNKGTTLATITKEQATELGKLALELSTRSLDVGLAETKQEKQYAEKLERIAEDAFLAKLKELTCT